MKWKRSGRLSRDIDDRRGRGGFGGPAAIGAGVGLPGLLIFLVISLLSGGGGELGSVLGELENPAGQGSGQPPPADDKAAEFTSFVLDDVQNFWEDTFRQSGKNYDRARLVLFDYGTSSGCGGARTEFGPHYCPADNNVYIDLSFFRELRQRYGAPGDFAQAYVIAHEVAHHVQNLLGINRRVREEQQADPNRQNDLSVRLELQADCLAGVWAFTTYERGLLEEGDLEEGLGAAAAVGDDRLQEQAGQQVNQETWTHGSSEQRMAWFQRGFEDGDPNDCDTFTAEI